jgi:hypothetical protein
MDRQHAYETASEQGFEGDVFHIETGDTGVGTIQHVRIELEDESGLVSYWHAEVSEVNGCEAFSRWDEDSEAFRRSCIAERKAAKKVARKTKKIA